VLCTVCGRDVVRTGRNQKYCPDCSKEQAKLRHREKERQRYRENAPKLRARMVAWYHRSKDSPEYKERKQSYYVENREVIQDNHREWRRQNQDTDRERKWRQKYGISRDDYYFLLDNQNGVCGICHEAPNGKALCVDHDHSTGKVRGLLCNRCNRCLGLLKDDSKILRRAIDYLESRKVGVADGI
jgi:hypothetical protein